MECPKCRQYNLPGSSYCEKCGLHLKALQRSPSRPASGPYSGYPETIPAVRPSPAPPPVPNLPGHGSPPVVPPQPVAAPPPPPPARVVATASPPVGRPAPVPPPPPPPRPAEPPPFAHLKDPVQGHALPLQWDRSLIGRESASDKIFPQVDLGKFPDNSGVSRRHAEIVRSEGQVFVEDLGSSNGTFLNEVRLQPGLQHPLRHHDEIRFGSLRFQYVQAP